MTTELKPCPNPWIEHVTKPSDRMMIRGPSIDGYAIACIECRIYGPTMKTVEQAAAAWNTRPEEDGLRARIAELEAGQSWQPMETAPRDGTEILVLFDDVDCVAVVSWDDETTEPQFPWASLENGHYHTDAFRAWRATPPLPEES